MPPALVLVSAWCSKPRSSNQKARPVLAFFLFVTAMTQPSSPIEPDAYKSSSTAILLYGLLLSVLAHGLFFTLGQPAAPAMEGPLRLTAITKSDSKSAFSLAPKDLTLRESLKLSGLEFPDITFMEVGPLTPTLPIAATPAQASPQKKAPAKAAPTPKKPAKKVTTTKRKPTTKTAKAKAPKSAAPVKFKPPAKPAAQLPPASQEPVVFRKSAPTTVSRPAPAASVLPIERAAVAPAQRVAEKRDSIELAQPHPPKAVLAVMLPHPEGQARQLAPNELEKAKAFITSHLVYPQSAIEEGLEGEVQVQLVLKQDGSIFTVRVMDSSGHIALDRAAVQAARQLPPMPAYASGEVVLPVRFKLP